MFDREWCSKHFQLKHELKLTGIIWDGMPLPLEPKEARIIAALLTDGYVNISDIAKPKSKSGTVYISNLRAKLRDLGCPLEIITVHGEQKYVLNTATLGGRKAENGGKANGSHHSASPSADCLQDISGGTA